MAHRQLGSAEMENPSPAELLTIDEFARRYSISRASVYRMAQSGALPMVKLGRSTRIRRTDAENWAASLPTRAG
jgi:excisionase family DNA binding protein